MKTWNLQFETTEDWKPLEAACWISCPVAILTPLGEVCRAKDLHDRKIGTICPMLRAISNDETNVNIKEETNE